MASLTVGGVNIKVAVSSPRWTRMDAVDRARAFDNTFRASQTGGAVRTWDFETPAVLAATEGETYKAALSTVASQLCSGDILAIPLMCSAELTDGVPTSVAGDPYVVLSFSLHEVQPAKTLLRYSPGDTITGESFSRASTATYYTTAGLVASAAIDVKRASHFPTIGGTRSLLLEGARTNALSFSEDLTNAAWTKTLITIDPNTATAPDGTATADKMIEDVSGATDHYLSRNFPALTDSTFQPFSFFAKAGGRSWVRVRTINKAGTVAASFINIATGAIGTNDASHTQRVTTLSNGWFRVEVVFPSATGATTPSFELALASADGTVAYVGDGTSGCFIWGIQFETDKVFASSYIPTAGAAATRSTDSYSLPFTTPPQEMTVYAKFVEGGTIRVAGLRILAIANSAENVTRFLLYNPSSVYGTYYETSPGNGVGSALAVAPIIGDTTELVGRLLGDGSTSVTQSINSAAETSGPQSAALGLDIAFSGALAWLNGNPAAGTTGFTALQSFKIVAGSRSLTELRAL